MFNKNNLATWLMALAGIMFFVAAIVSYTRSNEFDIKLVGFGVLFLGLSTLYYRRNKKRVENSSG